MRRLITICAIFFIVACSANSAMAQLWTESGDAGELLSTAQVVLGSGPLTAITGAYGDTNADLYQIYISDPAGFSAYADDYDPQLFLFDASGYGVEGNDDGGVGWDSNLTAGNPHNPTSTGIYYLGVSSYDYDPSSSTGLIFPSFPYDTIYGPTGPGGANPLNSWTGMYGNASSYEITLTGAQYVPVPGAVLLCILGLGAVGVKLRKFS